MATNETSAPEDLSFILNATAAVANTNSEDTFIVQSGTTI